MRNKIYDCESIQQTITNVIVNLNINLEEPLTYNSNLIASGIQSIDFMTLLIELEDIFSVEFVLEDFFPTNYSEFTLGMLIDALNKEIAKSKGEE